MRIQPAIILFIIGILILTPFAAAGDVTLAWDANSEPELVGYYLCYGSSSGQYSVQVDVGNVTQYTVSSLPAGTYYFAVKAYGIEGLESAFSNEVSATVAASDNQAPTITGVSASGITATGATISWTSNEAADSQVEYGTTLSYGTSTTLNSSLVTSHSQSLSGLAASTTYHYRVKSRDAAGNLATSGDYTFTTVDASDNTPPVISNVKASKIRGISATITWNTNEAADSVVEYGISGSPGGLTATSSQRISRARILAVPVSEAAPIEVPSNVETSVLVTSGSSRPKNRIPDSDTPLVTAHSIILNNLTPGSAYVYRVKSKDAAGNLAVSGYYTFLATSAGDIVTGLAAAYTFDEGYGAESADYSKNGNTAILHSTNWVEGKYGQALSFNGTSSYVAAGTRGLPDTSQPHTVSFWVSTDAAVAESVQESAGTILALANPERKASLRHGHKGSSAGALDFDNEWAVVGKLPTPRQWHHFGYIFDGSRNSLYIDGKLVSTSTIQPAAAPITAFEIGRWVDGSGYFEGSVDEVRVYNRALTEEQLRLAMITPVGGSGSIPEAAMDAAIPDDKNKATAPANARPVLSMHLERQTYSRGETVQTRELWISNPSEEHRSVEIKAWLELPGMQPISLGGLGMGDTVRLDPGFNRDYGVLPLMQIADDAPDGICRFGVRLVDPVTGELLAESMEPFSIGEGKAGWATPEIAIESQLEASQLRIENKDLIAAAIEVKMWFEAPDGSTLPAFSTQLVLPGGAEITLQAPMPAEGFVLKTRILDSSSGKNLATNSTNFTN
ncbi:MAG: fibronectin type III domain-containing protein [Acidobacteriota bacterium]|nr:fibronectin type III domain-containing protein [Acidobacteriota bacterium]